MKVGETGVIFLFFCLGGILSGRASGFKSALPAVACGLSACVTYADPRIAQCFAFTKLTDSIHPDRSINFSFSSDLGGCRRYP